MPHNRNEGTEVEAIGQEAPIDEEELASRLSFLIAASRLSFLIAAARLTAIEGVLAAALVRQ